MEELAQHFNISPGPSRRSCSSSRWRCCASRRLSRSSPARLLGGVVAVILESAAGHRVRRRSRPARSARLLKGVWIALATGFVSNTGERGHRRLLSRGGMAHMLSTVWLIMAALAFGAIVEHAGLLARIVDPIVRARPLDRPRSSPPSSPAARHQYRDRRPVYGDRSAGPDVPAQSSSNAATRRSCSPAPSAMAGTVTSPLMPWNSCGAYIAATLGVPTLSFRRLCVLLPAQSTDDHSASPLWAYAC